jgi:hypothetical protein
MDSLIIFQISLLAFLFVCYLLMLSELTLHITDNGVINGSGAAGEMRIRMGNITNQRKPAPVPLCQPQTDLGLNMRCLGTEAINQMNYGTAFIWIHFKVSHKSAIRNTNL